jgi:hypothetical protein
MQRRNFLAQASTLALSTGWLSACGGGGSTDTTPAAPALATPPPPPTRRSAPRPAPQPSRA